MLMLNVFQYIESMCSYTNNFNSFIYSRSKVTTEQFEMNQGIVTVVRAH